MKIIKGIYGIPTKKQYSCLELEVEGTMEKIKNFINYHIEGFIGIILIIVVSLIIIIPSIYASKKNAEVYNKLNGTNYTTSDFFWAKSQINQQSQTINIK